MFIELKPSKHSRLPGRKNNIGVKNAESNALPEKQNDPNPFFKFFKRVGKPKTFNYLFPSKSSITFYIFF